MFDLMFIYISFFLFSTSFGAMGSVCQSDASMSSLTAGCISSSFLHMNTDRQVKVGILSISDRFLTMDQTLLGF